VPNALLDILMVTYNRPDYTGQALPRLLDSCDDHMRVWVWHNGDHQPTLDVVRSFEGHPRMHRVHHSPENKRLREPTNWFWATSDADYLSRVDDDIVMPDGWGQKLREAHQADPSLGVLGCWSLLEEDIDEERALRKVRSAGSHRYMEHPWVGGAGHVLKRRAYEAVGPLEDGQSLPQYCLQVALRGFRNGFYFPFIAIDHLDDPRHPASQRLDATADEDLDPRAREREMRRLTRRQRQIARQLMRGPTEPAKYVGWSGRVRRAALRFGIVG
jgi:hypothetical protein